MSIIKEKVRRWLFEPKSSSDADTYLVPFILGISMLVLFIRAMAVVFAEGILSGIYIIFMVVIGATFMAAIIFVLFRTSSLVLRIAINLIINTYNYFKKGK